MKKVTVFAIAASTLFSCGTDAGYNKNVKLNNEVDSVSYSIGVNQGKGLKSQFSEANFDALVKGLKDALDSTEIITAEETQTVIQTYFQKKQAKEQEETFGNVKEDGIKFLADNKAKEGVQVTESGLQYVVLKEGNGNQPAASSNVKVHYHGTTPDGTVFDSSVDRGEPISFGLNQVIPGWTEGVQLMKVGAKYKFFIPQELAYGANAPGGGSGPIKPFMPLVFEVELLGIN
jgi:FKBP-type peptidyl-prolyl cis-trans isomerase